MSHYRLQKVWRGRRECLFTGKDRDNALEEVLWFVGVLDGVQSVSLWRGGGSTMKGS